MHGKDNSATSGGDALSPDRANKFNVSEVDPLCCNLDFDVDKDEQERRDGVLQNGKEKVNSKIAGFESASSFAENEMNDRESRARITESFAQHSRKSLMKRVNEWITVEDDFAGVMMVSIFLSLLFPSK